MMIAATMVLCLMFQPGHNMWAEESDEKDIVIYGATPAGLAAVVQARKILDLWVRDWAVDYVRLRELLLKAGQVLE